MELPSEGKGQKGADEIKSLLNSGWKQALKLLILIISIYFYIMMPPRKIFFFIMKC